jgi:hypothetical protein
MDTMSENKLTYRVCRNDRLVSANPVISVPYIDFGFSRYSLTTYKYEVTCVDEAGNESDRSLPFELNPMQGKFISVYRSESMIVGTRTIDTTVVRNVLEAALVDFSGINDIGKAYESFFPAISADKKIGIKINCLAGASLSTHPQLVDALIAGLATMLGGTFPAYNITIFDDRNPQMTQAGFPPRDTAGMNRVMVAPWSDESRTILETPQKLSSMLLEMDYLINVPVLKVHPYAGITFALKNYYGLIDNPSALHGNLCTPPNISPSPKSIYVGVDPVAMDLYALYRINKERALKNRALISREEGGDARHITIAGSAPYNLGSLAITPGSVEEKTI